MVLNDQLFRVRVQDARGVLLQAKSYRSLGEIKKRTYDWLKNLKNVKFVDTG